jgi:hypothetical protein
MPHITISFEIRSANAEIFLKYKKENESDSEAAERLLYECLSRLEAFTDEERTLEGIYVKLGNLQRSLMNMSMLLPYKPPF